MSIYLTEINCRTSIPLDESNWTWPLDFRTLLGSILGPESSGKSLRVDALMKRKDTRIGRMDVIKNIVVCVMLGSFMPYSLSAQEPTQRALKFGSDTVPQKPDYATPSFPEFSADPVDDEKVLPNVSPPSVDGQQLPAFPRVFVNDIILDGGSVMLDELDQIIRPFERRTTTAEELQELRHNLSRHYYRMGYVNSGVVIPDQEIVDGIITLRVVEGELGKIELSGNRRLNSTYITERIALGSDKPLNIHNLRRALGLIQQNPLIRRVNAKLEPGLVAGESVLQVEIEENRPFEIVVGADNERSPAVGGEQTYLVAEHRNLTGNGDVLSGQFSTTGDLDDSMLSYSYPLNARDTTISAHYAKGKSLVIEEPFNLIDVENESESLSLSLTHPFFNSLSRSLIGTLVIENKQSKTFLLGIPFSFAPGVNNGESEVSVVQTSLDWIRRDQDTAVALGSTLRVGIDAFGATINENSPDSKFESWQFQAQYARRLKFAQSQVIMRIFAQLTDEALLPIEKFAIGGIRSVRGYRESQFVRDNGVVASLEMRFPLYPDNLRPANSQRLQLVPFFDYGRSWDEDEMLLSSDPENISSIGLGLLWDPLPALQLELHWGYALRDLDNPNEDDIQDDGFHFMFSYHIFGNSKLL